MEDLLRRVPALVKVSGSAETLQKMLKFALPGGTLRHIPVPPAEVPLELNTQYFAIEIS